MEGEIIKYMLAGGAISIADKVTSLWASGDLAKAKEKKARASAVELIVKTYEDEKFDELMQDADFKEAFVTTQEYFTHTKTKPVAGPEKEEEPTHKKLSTMEKIKSYGHILMTPEFWKGEKINDASFKAKGTIALLIPLASDAIYAFGGMIHGTASVSQVLAEIGETIIEAPSLMVGLYLGKGVSKISDWRIAKYDRKLEKLERKITVDERLSNRLSSEVYRDRKSVV